MKSTLPPPFESNWLTRNPALTQSIPLSSVLKIGNDWLSNPDVVFWSVNDYFASPGNLFSDTNSPVGNGAHYFVEHDINISINNNDNIVYLN